MIIGALLGFVLMSVFLGFALHGVAGVVLWDRVAGLLLSSILFFATLGALVEVIA